MVRGPGAGQEQLHPRVGLLVRRSQMDEHSRGRKELLPLVVDVVAESGIERSNRQDVATQGEFDRLHLILTALHVADLASSRHGERVRDRRVREIGNRVDGRLGRAFDGPATPGSGRDIAVRIEVDRRLVEVDPLDTVDLVAGEREHGDEHGVVRRDARLEERCAALSGPPEHEVARGHGALHIDHAVNDRGLVLRALRLLRLAFLRFAQSQSTEQRDASRVGAGIHDQ
ncbi:hypothetical protein D3C86_1321930 [compost metagenome]